MTVGSNAEVTLGPGVYVFTGAVQFKSNAKVFANGGVTLFFTGTSSLYIDSNATLQVVAPNTGSTAGIGLWMNVNNGTISMNNNGKWVMKGALYAPNASLTLQSNASSQCTQIIARSFVLGSNATITLNHDCVGVGVSDVAGGYRLVQ